MEFDDIWNTVCDKFIPKLKTNMGLEYFVINRSKFEGWMKVELCESLTSLSTTITPEEGWIDIIIGDYAIELKTPSTNYKAENVLEKNRPITDNINGIIKDIRSLKTNTKYQNKSVMFIVFPLPNKSEKYWEKHLSKISNELKQIKFEEFEFINGVRGKIYFGEV